MSTSTNPEGFKKFHTLLMEDAPEGYEPFYFTLEKNGKDPMKGKSWKENRKTFTEAYNLMKQGYNIGIAATGEDKLVIVDIDDLAQVKDPKPTLMNVSRKRVGRHCYYFSEDPVAKSIFDNTAKQNIATEEAGEVRAVWQYVVAAGSYVPCAPEELDKIPENDKGNAGQYSVFVERSVTSITYDEIPEAYRHCLENKRAVDIVNKQKKDKKPQSQDKDDKHKSALYSLTIEDVSGKCNDPNHRFPSPFHGSKTYKDTSVTGNLLHCWRHNVSHNAMSYLAVESGISDCSSAGSGHCGSGSSNVDYGSPEVIFKLWTHAKSNGYLPDNDPMPSKAMVYYALQNKLCEEKDITDGWRIPTAVYNKVIEMADFNTGREKREEKVRKPRNFSQQSGSVAQETAEELQSIIPIHFDVSKNYWLWNQDTKQYQITDETEILVQIKDELGITIDKAEHKAQVLENIRQTGRSRRVKETKKEWIQFENKVVDIETMKEFEATPEYFFAAPIPHKIGNSDDTPTIDRLFKSWLGDKAELLYEICAYCLYDDYPIQRIFTFVGSGSNGKGQFQRLLINLVGEENKASTDIETLQKNNFAASKLYKKKVAIIGETNYTLARTGLIKSLSGGDPISCEFKGKNAFDFINTAKIIIATNGLPQTTDQSEGFYRRWCLIEFKNKFPDGKSAVATIPEWEYENLCYKCIRILKNILDLGKLPHEDVIEKRKSKYEDLSNPVKAFLTEECNLNDNEAVPGFYLYKKYDTYREQRGHRKISNKEFYDQMHEMGYISNQKWYNKDEAGKYSPGVNEGKNWRAIEGISYNTDGQKNITSSRFDTENNKPYIETIGNPSGPNAPNSSSTWNSQLKNRVESSLGPLGELENTIDYKNSNEENENKSNENIEISPLHLLDSLIIQEAKSVYHSIVQDEFEFVKSFCQKIPYFDRRLVNERLVILKKRGWK